MRKKALLFVIAVSIILGLLAWHRFPFTKPALAVVPDKMVTLTFDDGPDPRFTPEIIKLLEHEDIEATFFVIGENALAHPDLLTELARQGHTIANHTQTHPHLEELSNQQVTAEIKAADYAVNTILGPAADTHYFRPPRGKLSNEISAAAENLNKELILWNVCVENQSTQTPDEVRNRVMKLIRERNGGIILAHDGELDRSLTVQSLPLIIHALKQEGYSIVSLEEYLQARKIKSELKYPAQGL